MLLNTDSPTMYLIYYIHRHISQSSHIYKNVADHFDGLFYCLIYIYNRVALHLHPLHVCSFFRCLCQVLLVKKCQKFSRFGYIPPYFIYTLLASLNRIVHYMKETSAFKQGFVFILQCRFNDLHGFTFECTKKSIEIERWIVL